MCVSDRNVLIYTFAQPSLFIILKDFIGDLTFKIITKTINPRLRDILHIDILLPKSMVSILIISTLRSRTTYFKK
jgi:hypothetical protein